MIYKAPSPPEANMIYRSVAWIGIAVGILSIGAMAADAPEPPANLGKDGVQYVPPPSELWEPTKHSTDKAVGYVTRTHDGIIALEMLPDEMIVDGKATVKQLHAAHAKAKVKVLLEPVVETDERFALKVHERYEIGIGENMKTADQLHIYRYGGKHIFMVTVNSIADDAAAVTAAHETAEDMLLSVTGPGIKMPKKFTTRPSTQPRPAAKPKS
jgi:hypothetical protein